MARILSVAALCLVVLHVPAAAQSRFTNCVSRTGDDATLIIPTAISPSLLDKPLTSRDEIAVFTPSGLCVGSTRWTGKNLGITVWGDDTQTRARDGLIQGERLELRVWDASARTEYSTKDGSLQISFDGSQPHHNASGTYGSNSIYVLASLTAGQSTEPAPDPSFLIAPAERATGLATKVKFRWNAVAGAKRYDLQISLSPDFSKLAAEYRNLKRRNQQVRRLSRGKTYYWRITARDKKGVQTTSEIRSFTTAKRSSRLQAEAGSLDAETISEPNLYGNYPNPFQSETVIEFDVHETTPVVLRVYDVRGALITTLVSETLPTGTHQVRWNAGPFPSGIYLCHLMIGQQQFTRKLALVR